MKEICNPAKERTVMCFAAELTKLCYLFFGQRFAAYVTYTVKVSVHVPCRGNRQKRIKKYFIADRTSYRNALSPILFLRKSHKRTISKLKTHKRNA